MTPDAQVAAALATVKRAGRLVDLADSIAAAWCEARERKLARTIGAQEAMALDLQRFLKFSRQQADEAARQYLDPSYSEVATAALLAFAQEIETPPAPRRESRIRPIQEVRATWTPHGDPDDLPSSAPPASKPSIRRPAAPNKRRLA